MLKRSQYVCIIVYLLMSNYTQATIGYFQTAYGTRALGMGGVAVAYPQDSIVAAINPAGMVRLDDRLDAGVNMFAPIRRYCYTGSDHSGIRGAEVGSGSNFFPIPHFGIKRTYKKDHALGLTLYGNGGLNTNWKKPNPAFGTSRLGGNVLQLVLAPSYSYHHACYNQSFGVAPLVTLQFLKLKGLQNFKDSTLSIDPCNVTNNGHSTAFGLGFRVGWMGTFWDHLTLGFSYATPTWCSRFHKYKGIIANKGSFDIPQHLYAGFALRDMCGFDMSADVGYIMFGTVRSLHNPICNFAQLPFNPMDPHVKNKFGSKCGAGFGWKNVVALKLGFAYRGIKNYVARLGYVHNTPVYDATQMDLNILAPAVVQDAFTIGFTKRMDANTELDVAYNYVFDHKISGQSQFGLGTITHMMYQHLLSFNYAYTFG